MRRFLLLYMRHFNYGAAFVLLAVAGLAVPVPQDLTLLLAGYLIQRGVMDASIALPVCVAGAVTGDVIGFFIVRKGAARLQKARLFGRILTPERFARAQDGLARHEAMTIAVARNVTGVRAVVFATAGATGTRFSRFLLWDALAAIPNVALLLSLGYIFSDRLKAVTRDVGRAQRWLALAILGLAALWSFVSWRRRRRRAVPAPVD